MSFELVAKQLKQEAFGQSGSSEKDSFGRSAFNRYYYAIYLLVRAGLTPMNGTFPSAHKDVPEFLVALTRKDLSRAAARARKAGDFELASNVERAKAACHSLAGIMKKGYEVRVKADYYPEIKITFISSKDFALESTTVSEAEGWWVQANSHAKTISNVWKQVNA